MMNKVAIFSDLHLGVHQNSDFWLDASNKWCEWFVSDLKNKKISDIVFCGDFFHYRDEISVKTLSYARNILDKLLDFNVYMIPGNHDAWYKYSSEINSISIFKNTKNIQIFDTLQTVKLGNKNATFCPWGTDIKNIKESDIIFGHFELKNFKINSYKICDDGDDPEILVEKAPIIFSGHFHLRDEKALHNSKIVYTGNPFEMDFGDSQSSKGYYILDTDNLSYQFVENPSYCKHSKLLLSNLIKITEVDSYLIENVKNNIVKLVIDKNISTDHLNILTTKLGTYKPVELRIDYEINYNKIKVPEKKKNVSDVDIEECIYDFIDMLNIENKDEVIEYTINLYSRAKA